MTSSVSGKAAPEEDDARLQQEAVERDARGGPLGEADGVGDDGAREDGDGQGADGDDGAEEVRADGDGDEDEQAGEPLRETGHLRGEVDQTDEEQSEDRRLPPPVERAPSGEQCVAARRGVRAESRTTGGHRFWIATSPE